MLLYRATPSAANAILFVHGFPFHGGMWEAQLAALPPEWHGVAPDLRGFGSSPGSDDESYTMEMHAEDLIELMDGLELERAVVCGLSMGGYVALALWRLAPQRVRALVLCDTKAGADSEEVRSGRRELAARVSREGPRAVAESMLPKLAAARTRADRPEAVAAIERMILETAPETLVRALAGLAARADATELLETISVPTLVVVGSDDAITPPTEAELIAERIQGAHLAVLQGAGHVSNLEQPDEFNAQLRRFLNGLVAVM